MRQIPKIFVCRHKQSVSHFPIFYTKTLDLTPPPPSPCPTNNDDNAKYVRIGMSGFDIKCIVIRGFVKNMKFIKLLPERWQLPDTIDKQIGHLRVAGIYLNIDIIIAFTCYTHHNMVQNAIKKQAHLIFLYLLVFIVAFLDHFATYLLFFLPFHDDIDL